MTSVADGSIVGGVDTHKDLHVAAAVDGNGRIVGTGAFPATAAGYRRLLRWLRGLGRVERVGVEGTGSYGSGLARHLAAAGVEVVEVDRPDRRLRRRRGKSDTVDAEAAARAALSGTASGTPKARTGTAEMVRVLRVARRSALKARTQAANQLHALRDAAPTELRERLRPLRTAELLARAARFRPGPLNSPTAATRAAMTAVARRHLALDAEIAGLDAELERLLAAAAPDLLARHGVGVDTAGALLVAAGDNPHRLRSERSFAALCGVSPLDASSGRQRRHRLNRGGDRQANNALWRIVLVRMSNDPRTRDYVARRTAEGRTKREIMRCLKRYVAREVYAELRTLQL